MRKPLQRTFKFQEAVAQHESLACEAEFPVMADFRPEHHSSRIRMRTRPPHNTSDFVRNRNDMLHFLYVALVYLRVLLHAMAKSSRSHPGLCLRQTYPARYGVELNFRTVSK